MRVVLSKAAEKYFVRLNEPTLSRIRNALAALAQEPPQGDIKRLEGRDEHRLRIGDYRALFRIEGDTIIITAIAHRGQVYKE